MFKNNLYTYSFIKTLYDKKRDYLDTFSPLMYSVLSKDDFSTIDSIQSGVKKKYDLKFPNHLIKTVTSRGRRQGLLDSNKEGTSFKLSATGVQYVKGIESNDDVERRINALGADLIKYFASRGLTKTKQEVADLVQSFIAKNLGYLVDLFGTNGTESVAELGKNDESIFLDYVQEAIESKPDQYGTLKELIYGSIIASLIYVRNTAELTDLEQRTFKSARVYLDTNIIFSALGFHTPEMQQSANELLDLVKKAGLELWAFEFTLDEICGYFRSYATEGHKFPVGIKIDSVLSSFKQQGLGLSDINEMIVKIEYILADIDIRIDPTPDVSLKNYQSSNELLQGRINAHKLDKPVSSVNHDLAAIDYIRKYRKGSVRSIEDAKAIFLTADNALNRTCMETFNHSEKGTLPETILDRLFANILWLKNPDIDLPVNLIIASHSRDLLVDRSIWERFHTVLMKLKNEGTVTDDQVATLFYKNQIEDSLRDFKKVEVDKVTEKFVTDEIEKAGKLVESTHASLEREKQMLESSLFESGEQIKEGQQNSEKIQQIRERIRISAKKSAGWCVQFSVFLMSLILTFIEGIIIFWLIDKGVDVTEILLAVFLAVIFSSGGVVNWRICESIKYPVYKQAYATIFKRKMKILE